MSYYHRKKCQWHFLCIKLLATEIVFYLFVKNLFFFCLFVDAGQKEGLQGFECKRSLCSTVEETLRLKINILR